MNGSTGNVKFIYTDKSTESQATSHKTSIVFGEDGSLWAQGMQYIPANAQFTDTTYSAMALNELQAGSTTTARLLSAQILNQAYNINDNTITIGATSIDVPITELSNNYEMSTDENDDLFLEGGDTYEEAFGKLEKSIVDNEEIITNALTDLDSRIIELDDKVDNIHIPNIPVTSVNGMTGAVSIDMELSSSYETSSDSNSDLLLGAGDTYDEAFGKLEKARLDNEEVIAHALNNLNSAINDIPNNIIAFDGIVNYNNIDSIVTPGLYKVKKEASSTESYAILFVDKGDLVGMYISQTLLYGGTISFRTITDITTDFSNVNWEYFGNLPDYYEMSDESNDDLLLEAGDSYEEAFGKLEKNIIDNEKVITLAVTDLDNKINKLDNKVDNIHIPSIPVKSVNGMTGNVVLKLPNNYIMSTERNNNLALEGGDTFNEAFGKLEKAIVDDEETLAASINDLSQKVELNYEQLATYINNVSYVSNDKKIYFKNNNVTLAQIDTTDFIKDGMVSSVVIDTPTTGTNANTDCLIISFNTDAGQSPIEIPLTSIFNPNNYYTKRESGNAKIFAGTCSTAGATAAKVVTCSEFISTDLVQGALIFVTFSETNTGAIADMTLDVNGTGAKRIRKIYTNSSPAALQNAGELRANQTYLFGYDSTYWVCMTLDYNSNTTYSAVTTEQLVGATVTTGYRISPSVLHAAYYINGNTINLGPDSLTIQTELSSSYETSTDLNDDLLLAEGDTYEEAFGKLEKAIIDNEEVSAGSINYLNRRINDLEAIITQLQSQINNS